MAFLDRISGPDDLKSLSRAELETLAEEIRRFLIRNVSHTGGHLGPNLGVVELTIAIHRIFDSPVDPILFDVGHQAYVHKILTGRQAMFPTLRQREGLSGYPSRAESEHDWVENSHASAALSWATGMAEGLAVRGETQRTVVVVVGDGALTGGMAWEALNNLSAHPDLPVVVVVNDNGRSYEPTVGGLAHHLSALRTDPRYEQTLDVVKRSVSRTPVVGRPAYELLHGLKTGVKDVLAPQGMFSDLRLKYIGPINGHDVVAVMRALDQARKFRGPVLVHCITQKGRGFRAAEEHEEDRFHTIGQIDERTGRPLIAHSRNWTDAFSDSLLRIGEARPDVVALTAAMLHPTGLAPFHDAHPDRVFDVGIAEQHAVASAAGLASAGLHPVVALYSTFLNRAFDQVLMDVGLHHLGVTFVLDRAGITGPDGASHHGIWDVSLLSLVPGMRLASPRDAQRLDEALTQAVGVGDAPTAIRYSKESLPVPIPAVRQVGGMDLVREQAGADVLLVPTGAMVVAALGAADLLQQQGIVADVLDPVWTLPVNPQLAPLAARHRLVVTIEDNVTAFGNQVRTLLAEADVRVPVVTLGVPDAFIEQASRAQILDACGLTPQKVATTVTERFLTLTETQLPTEATIPAVVRRVS